MDLYIVSNDFYGERAFAGAYSTEQAAREGREKLCLHFGSSAYRGRITKLVLNPATGQFVPVAVIEEGDREPTQEGELILL